MKQIAYFKIKRLRGLLALVIIALSVSAEAYAPNSCQDVFESVGHADKYHNFADLARHEVEGEDFTITAHDRKSPLTVLAIHAGFMEPMTGTIARMLAGETHNLYLFEGHKRQGKSFDLHVTSRHFDEPRALQLLAGAQTSISLHGFRNRNICWICMGGMNSALANRMQQNLRLLGLPHWRVSYPCHLFPAKEKENIVNHPSLGGVQLELSTKLRNEFAANPASLDLFVEILKKSLNP